VAVEVEDDDDHVAKDTIAEDVAKHNVAGDSIADDNIADDNGHGEPMDEVDDVDPAGSGDPAAADPPTEPEE
jgi:hypothetical protein